MVVKLGPNPFTSTSGWRSLVLGKKFLLLMPVLPKVLPKVLPGSWIWLPW